MWKAKQLQLSELSLLSMWAHVRAGDGVLFEFIEAQWRERGRGELRVNVGGGGQARLVMRQRGNLRLLLNANLFPGMKHTPMDGGKVRDNSL